MNMKNTHYLPIFRFGDNPESVHNSSYGSHLYSDLQMLACYEPDAIGYIEVEVSVPTENEFKTRNGLKSGAV